jgi:N-acetylmuramoyl-L-alanine amidase
MHIIYCFLFIMLPVSVGQEQLTHSSGLKAKTIYLDPWYGGKEKGPLLRQKQYAKDITLQIAQQLEAQLAADGFKVQLSRSGDARVSADARVSLARGIGSDIYLSIKISQQKKECVRIKLFSPGPQKYPREAKYRTLDELKADLDNIMQSLQIDTAYEESLQLAHIIAKELKKTLTAKCVNIIKSSDHVLAHAEMPAVIVDFGVLITPFVQPYILDTKVQDKIVRDIAASIKMFAEERSLSAKPH